MIFTQTNMAESNDGPDSKEILYSDDTFENKDILCDSQAKTDNCKGSTNWKCQFERLSKKKLRIAKVRNT